MTLVQRVTSLTLSFSYLKKKFKTWAEVASTLDCCTALFSAVSHEQSSNSRVLAAALHKTADHWMQTRALVQGSLNYCYFKPNMKKIRFQSQKLCLIFLKRRIFSAQCAAGV